MINKEEHCSPTSSEYKIIPDDFTDTSLLTVALYGDPSDIQIMKRKTLELYNDYLRKKVKLSKAQVFSVLKSLFHTFSTKQNLSAFISSGIELLKNLVENQGTNQQFSFVIMSLINAQVLVVEKLSTIIEDPSSYTETLLSLFEMLGLKAGRERLACFLCVSYLGQNKITEAKKYFELIKDLNKWEKTSYLFDDQYIDEVAKVIIANPNSDSVFFASFITTILKYLIHLYILGGFPEGTLGDMFLKIYLKSIPKDPSREEAEEAISTSKNIFNALTRISDETELAYYRKLISLSKKLRQTVEAYTYRDKLSAFQTRNTHFPPFFIVNELVEAYSGLDNDMALEMQKVLYRGRKLQKDFKARAVTGLALAESYLKAEDVKSANEVLEEHICWGLNYNNKIVKSQEAQIDLPSFDMMVNTLQTILKQDKPTLFFLKINIFRFFIYFRAAVSSVISESSLSKFQDIYNIYEKLSIDIAKMNSKAQLMPIIKKVYNSQEPLYIHTLKQMLSVALYLLPDDLFHHCIDYLKDNTDLVLVSNSRKMFSALKAQRSGSNGLDTLFYPKKRKGEVDKMDLFDFKANLAILSTYLNEERYSLSFVRKYIGHLIEPLVFFTATPVPEGVALMLKRFKSLSDIIRDLFVYHVLDSFQNPKIFLEIFLLFFNMFRDITSVFCPTEKRSKHREYYETYKKFLPLDFTDDPSREDIIAHFQKLNDLGYELHLDAHKIRLTSTRVPEITGSLPVAKTLSPMFDVLFLHMTCVVFQYFSSTDIVVAPEYIANKDNFYDALLTAVSPKKMLDKDKALQDKNIKKLEKNETAKNKQLTQRKESFLRLFKDLNIEVNFDEDENFLIFCFKNEETFQVISKFFEKRKWLTDYNTLLSLPESFAAVQNKKDFEVFIAKNLDISEENITSAYYPLLQLTNKEYKFSPENKKQENESSSKLEHEESENVPENVPNKKIFREKSTPPKNIVKKEEVLKKIQARKDKKNKEQNIPSKVTANEKSVTKTKFINQPKENLENGKEEEKTPTVPSVSQGLQFFFFAKETQAPAPVPAQKKSVATVPTNEYFLQYALNHGVRLRNLNQEISESKIYEVTMPFVWRATLYNLIRMFNALYMSQDKWVDLSISCLVARDYRNILMDRLDFFIVNTPGDFHQSIFNKADGLYQVLNPVTQLIEVKRNRQDLHNIRSAQEVFEKHRIYKKFLNGEKKPNHLNLDKAEELVKNPFTCLKFIMDEITAADHFMQKIVTSDDKIGYIDRIDAARLSLIFIGDMARLLRDYHSTFCVEYFAADLTGAYSEGVKNYIRKGQTLLNMLPKLSVTKIEHLSDLMHLDDYFKLCIEIRNSLGHDYSDVEQDYRAIYQAEEISEHTCCDLIDLSKKMLSLLQEISRKQVMTP